MSLSSFFSCNPIPDDTDCGRKALLAFDVAAFILFSLAFVYYTNFYQPQWLTNDGVLQWESSNTRPLIFLYIYVVFFITTRLSLINHLGSQILPSRMISIESRIYVNAHWLLKIVLFGVFSYIIFASIFLPLFNDGFGSTHVSTGLNPHILANLAPITQHLEYGKTLYLDTPAQYAPGVEYLLGALSETFSLSLADAYRIQLLLNLTTLIIFCGFIIGLTGPVFGSVIILFALTPFGIINNYGYPGWGFLHRWMAIPVFSIILARILTSGAIFPRQYLQLAILGMAWAIFALLSQENFGSGLIAYSLVFILLLRFHTGTLQTYARKYLFFIAIFSVTFFVLVGLFFGFDRLPDFFALYTKFSGRVFAGASSLFLTDTEVLANNTQALIFLGIVFLGVPILTAAIHLISTVHANQFYTRDIGIFAAIIAAAISLNLFSFTRGDVVHVRSYSFMMLPMFAAYIVFYCHWFSERSTLSTTVSFLTAILIGAIILGSHAQAKQYLSALLSRPDTDNFKAWIGGQRDGQDLPSLAPFLISPSDQPRQDAYRSVLGRYSSLAEEQRWAIKHYAANIARLAEIRLALHNRDVVPNWGAILTEGDLFLTGLKSATAITSPTTNVWTEDDLDEWRSDARGRDQQCVSTRVSGHIGWLAAPDKLADLRIERVVTAETFAGKGSTETFDCKCTPTDGNPDCHAIQYYARAYLTRVKSDFSSVKSALEKFHADKGHYPLSSDGGKGWDGAFAKEGFHNPWIQGLKPGYILKLPRDPRGGLDPDTNYSYRSDGNAYKLLAQNPFPLSCQIATLEYPMLVDPTRSGPECNGVALYSEGAESW